MTVEVTITQDNILDFSKSKYILGISSKIYGPQSRTPMEDPKKDNNWGNSVWLPPL